MTPQVKSIIAHVTPIGWIIAVIINSSDKDEFTSFYLRQVLGLYLIGLIGSLIPRLNAVISLVILVLWIMSIMGAIQKERKETPYVGRYFQEWFRNL